MRLKSFYGKTAADAMAKVKEELGNDALIISSTQDGPDSFHITTSIEQYEKKTPQANNCALADQITEKIHDLLNAQKMPFETTQKIINDIENHIDTDVGKTLENFFSQKLLIHENNHKIDYLIGHFGAGKTLSTIKLASTYHLQGLSLALITTDHEKIAGIESLESLADFLNIELTTVEDQHALIAAVEFNQDKDKILIDSAGMNPYNIDSLNITKSLQASQFDINTIFVTPANIDPFELEDMLTHLSQITIDTLCYTKVDLCQRVAAMLHAITHFDIPNHLISSTDSVDEELKTLDAKEILALLLSQKTQSSLLQKVS